MTTTLPATLDSISYEDLAELTGMPTKISTFLPRLTINRDPTDDDNNTLPPGSYSVLSRDGMAYGRPVMFRPFINSYQIIKFDPDKGTYTDRSIIFKNWKEEKIDSGGGVGCGKVSRKQYDQLSVEEKAAQRNLKTNRLLFGVVSFEGVNAKGTPVTVNNLPVVWKTTGINFMPVGNALDIFAKKKLPAFKFNIALDTKRVKNGSNVFYEAILTPDFTNVLPVGGPELELLELFTKAINDENAEVRRLHMEAKKSSPNVIDATYEELGKDLNDPVEDVGEEAKS